MDGRFDHISKGKMKADEKTIRMLREWDELTQELNDGDNVIITAEPVESEMQCHWKSNDNVISNVDPVESEPDKQIKDNTIQRELSRIMHAIASLGETHTV